MTPEAVHRLRAVDATPFDVDMNAQLAKVQDKRGKGNLTNLLRGAREDEKRAKGASK